MAPVYSQRPRRDYVPFVIWKALIVIDLRHDLKLALDPSGKLKSRSTAVESLSDSDDPTALDALTAVASDGSADPRVVAIAGRCVARVMIRQGTLGSVEYERVPFHDLRGEAFDAYDEAIAAYVRERD